MSRIIRGLSESVKELERSAGRPHRPGEFRSPVFHAFRSSDTISLEEAKELAAREAEAARQIAFVDAEAKLKEPLQQSLESLENVLDEISRFRRDLFREAETEAVDLIKRLCALILGEELKREPENILKIFQKAVSVIEKEKFIHVRVNPSDAELFRQAKADFLQKFASLSDIEIEEDDSVPVSGAILKSETRQVDMTVEQMVEHLISSARESLNESKETGDEGDKV